MKTHDKSYMSPEGRTKWNSDFRKCSGTRWLGAQGSGQSHSPRVQDVRASQACNGRGVTAGQDQTL